MNAPAQIRIAKRADYVPQVKAFVPLCEGEELELRCSILLCRDRATAASRRCSDEALGVLEQVQRLSATYAFSTMTIDRLRLLRAQIIRLVSCASSLETFAFTGAYPDEGEANEGGR